MIGCNRAIERICQCATGDVGFASYCTDMHVNSISGSDLSLADGRPARQNTSLRNGAEQRRETGVSKGVWDGGNGSDAQECELMKAQAVMGAFSLPEMTRDDPRRPSAQNRKRSVILFCGLHVMDLIWSSLSGTEGVGEAFGAGSRLGWMCGWRSSRSEVAWTPSAGRCLRRALARPTPTRAACYSRRSKTAHFLRESF
jgi:hypothetical protein